MKIYTPLTISVRVVAYSLLMLGVAEIIRLDALYPMEDGYYGEISFTEFSQEIILLALVVLYLVLGRKYKPIQPVANIVSLFFLVSFIREFNFLISWWPYLTLPVLFMIIWLVIRDFKKLKGATQEFFAQPASAWLFSGILITYVFSRLFGRSAFWLLLYDESNYRIAKAATEEGLELAGDMIMLISAIEFLIAIAHIKKQKQGATKIAVEYIDK
jgi:hypothetical protein